MAEQDNVEFLQPISASSNDMSMDSRLRAMWCELLHVDEVYDDDDFFELGGDSLAAIRLIELIGKEFGEEFIEPDIIYTASRFSNLRAAVSAAAGV